MITKRIFNVDSSKEYEEQVRAIVEFGTLWGAVKSDSKILEVDIDGSSGFALETTQEVFVLADTSWDGLIAKAKIDPETLDFYDTPKFKTIDEPDSIRMGYFYEVFKRGYIVFPLTATHDFNNNPIAIRKG